MELNKWEIEFKEQLNSREIMPSENAWAKLDVMLSVAEKPKTKFPWMYIAASFVGFLLIGSLYFSQKENAIEIEKNKVTIQKTIESKTNEMHLNANANNVEDVVVVTVSKRRGKSNNMLMLKNEILVVKNSFSPNQELVSFSNQIKESESIQSQASAVTVDELLSKASKSLRANKKPNPNLSIHVNANNLLLQTNGESEPAFRQNMFSKVVEDLRTVKVVINREEE